ncbi:MAG: 1-acyl-sn-glycerol-3-phosphate acyltransferase [Oscillospiraceae bacterium]|nr:1-acyl-sn-glycerol-3-phosphate acyltransferase [Oscillospiraceae bacterium]
MSILRVLLWMILLPLAAFLVYLAVLFIYSFTVDMKKPIEKPSKFARKQIDFVIPPFNRICGIRLKKSGLDKLPRDQRFLVVCNHRSLFDPTTAVEALKGFDVNYISKPENFKLPLVGPFIHAAGSLSIDRDNDRQALRDILQAAEYIKKDFCSMCIYPEGTRSKGSELLPFHAGSFKLAQKAGVGIAVAAVEGTEKVKSRLLRKTPVSFDVLEFIPAEKVKEMKATELADYSRNLIMEHLNG